MPCGVVAVSVALLEQCYRAMSCDPSAYGGGKGGDLYLREC